MTFDLLSNTTPYESEEEEPQEFEEERLSELIEDWLRETKCRVIDTTWWD